MELDARYLVYDTAELSELYGAPRERSVRKQIDHLDEYCRMLIAASPLVIMGTQGAGPDGASDNSPRGGAPGFVRVADDHTLLIPDHRGNNRLDAFHNIIHNPSVGLLFLIPGLHETFRVNGEGRISRDPLLLESLSVNGKVPRTVLVVTVQEAYLHCGRALLRADLWNPAKFMPRQALPSFGTILAAHTRGFVDAKSLDEENEVRVQQTLY